MTCIVDAAWADHVLACGSVKKVAALALSRLTVTYASVRALRPHVMRLFVFAATAIKGRNGETAKRRVRRLMTMGEGAGGTREYYLLVLTLCGDRNTRTNQAG